MESFRLGYRPALDGLRGMAVLMVMTFHFGFPFWTGGFFGVDIFFVLSGFLITCLLVDEWHTTGSVRLKNFYARRGLRLFPALFVLLIVTAPFVSRVWTLIALTYVSNWFLALQFVTFSPISHVWSLSVEEQFYLVWPIALVAMLRWRAPRLVIVGFTSLGVLASALLKIILWSDGATWIRLYHATDVRADDLLVGCLLALLISWNMLARGRWFRRAVQVASVLATVAVAQYSVSTVQASASLYRDGGLTLVAVAVALVILQIVSFPLPLFVAILSSRELVAVGRISYGLYLWHYPLSLLPVSQYVGGLNGAEVFTLRVVASFALAILSYTLVEKPSLRLKRRLEVSVSGSFPGAR